VSFEHEQPQRGTQLEVETPTQAVARKVARKAVSLSLGDSLASSPVGDPLAAHGEPAHGAQAHGEPAAGKSETASETAEDGFRGTPVELPHRAELEKSFGVSFAGVKAYTDEHARRATERLDAKAYAAGNRIAFRMPNPDKALVAHELTHVLQHTGQGPAKKADGGGDGGIEVAGEDEAERVEAAVSSDQPAHGALEGGHAAEPGGHAAEPGGHANGEAHGEAHGQARGATGASSPAGARRPALSKTAFGTGMTFSPRGFEKQYTYDLWKAREIEVPVGAVPGLNLLVEPSVQVKVGGGVNWKKKSVETNVGVEGEVGVGFSYGNSHIASVYGETQASLHGGFTYEREKSHAHIHDWDLNGGFALATNFAVGVKLGGGIVDAKFAFGHCDIGRLTGLHWDNGRFDKNKIGWEWGAQPQAFFHKIHDLIEKVKHILSLPKEAAKKAWKGMSGAIKGLGGIVKKIHIPDLTPWDGLTPF
jgi:Domain of unknown function (DUF4157)